ncbi:MAG: acyltransferase family protein [Synechococcales cyanobacterium CRU_2_2]|nr:acyltransferase family protein [Synechococcales cyanobacterium CRU_2_2]
MPDAFDASLNPKSVETLPTPEPSPQPPPDPWLGRRRVEFIQQCLPLWEWLYRHYFRVETQGWQHVPPAGQSALFVGSHNGGLASPDTVMMMVDWFRRFGPERPIYGLMHPKVWQASPPLAAIAEWCGAIEAQPKLAIAALQSGASVLVYPGGSRDVFRPHRDRGKIQLAGHQGFIKIALRQQVPIIPVISSGAHDTLIVLEDLYPLVKQLNQWGMPWLMGIDPEVFPVYLGLPWGLGIGPIPNLPLPVPIKTQVCAPIMFEWYGREAAQDRSYVQNCFERVQQEMQQALDRLMN